MTPLIDKNILKIQNEKFKVNTLESLKTDREKCFNHLKTNKERYLKLNELARYNAIAHDVQALSYFKDKGTLELIKSLGLTTQTPKAFVCHLDFFRKLDEFQLNAEYYYLYYLIWGHYRSYSDSIVLERMAFDFDLNLSEIAGRVNRQKDNLNFPRALKDMTAINRQIMGSVKKEMPKLKFKISEDNPYTSYTHIIKYPHKYELFHLYHDLVEMNKENIGINFHEPDFKCEFFDLLKVVFRDKHLLNPNKMQIEDYVSLRRYKIKYIESFILK
jgi:hypothetical protein